MRIISIYLLLFVAQSVFAASPLPPTYRDGQMTFSFYGEYFTTNHNYDRYSNTIALPSGNYYNNFTATIDGRFDLPENWVLAAGINYAYAQSKGEDLLTFLPKNRTNSEITEAHAYAQYFIDYDRFRIVPELKGSVSFKKIGINDYTNDSVLTNDYTDTAEVGTWAIINFGQMRAFGYGGFEYQDDNRENTFNWEAGLLWRSRNVLVMGSFDGYQPVINDTYYQTYSRENRTFYVDGESFRYYATNPSLTEVKLMAGYAFDNVQIIAGYGATVMGNETAMGQMYMVGFSVGVDMAGGPSASFTKKKHKHHADSDSNKSKDGFNETKDKEDGFQPDVEEYDESLFD